MLTALGAFYASARSLQIGDAVAVVAATAAAANLLGIIGGVVVFGDPLGSDAGTVAGRVVAFVLVVLAVGLIPAPVRAQRAMRSDSSPEGDGERPAVEPGYSGVSATTGMARSVRL